MATKKKEPAKAPVPAPPIPAPEVKAVPKRKAVSIKGANCKRVKAVKS